MSCFHPSFIQRTVESSTGDVSTRFLGSIDGINRCLESDAILREAFSGKKVDDFIPRTYTKVGFRYYHHDFIKVPCGKCIGCRIDYSRSWADRMTYHSFGKEGISYFFTLTYDDDHLDELEHSDNYDLYALNYDDMTLFIKRLRKRFPDMSLDYYYSGEYGDNSFRPHFHMIVYNLLIPDLQFWKLNDNGDPLYSSAIIENLWGKGFVCIGDFSWRNSAYTASYVEKKRDGRALCEYTAVGLTPEKCRCSRRPGIAHDFYVDNYHDIWLNEGMSVSRDVNSSGHLGIPRYFRKLAEKPVKEGGLGLEEYVEFKKRVLDRGNLLNPLKIENSSFDLNRVGELLKFEERNILSQSKNRKI